MSMDNARAFYEKVRIDKGLQQKIGQAAKESPQELGAFVIKTAQENGFVFNEAEMKAFLTEESKRVEAGGELKDFELESVAGGSKGKWIAMSIISAGLGCGMSAIAQHIEGGCYMDQGGL